jgi:aspartyl-tRNA(Asn)/glutamyl-tRNA(Gln) amidotransferase subunit C
MGIPVDEVRRIAALAQLELGEQELEHYAQQLGAILDYMNQLRQVDTDGVDPDSGIPVWEDLLRADISLPSLDREDALANAPDPEHGHFGVPRVIG